MIVLMFIINRQNVYVCLSLCLNIIYMMPDNEFLKGNTLILIHMSTSNVKILFDVDIFGKLII